MVGSILVPDQKGVVGSTCALNLTVKKVWPLSRWSMAYSMLLLPIPAPVIVPGVPPVIAAACVWIKFPGVVGNGVQRLHDFYIMGSITRGIGDRPEYSTSLSAITVVLSAVRVAVSCGFADGDGGLTVCYGEVASVKVAVTCRLTPAAPATLPVVLSATARKVRVMVSSPESLSVLTISPRFTVKLLAPMAPMEAETIPAPETLTALPVQ